MVPFSKHLMMHYIRSAQDIYAMKQLRLMIVDNESKARVGVIDLFDFEPLHQRAGVGILIDPAAQKKGFGFAALSLLEVYALNHIGIRNLYCSIHADNLSSLALFEKAGYQKVGERKSWYNVAGTWVDELLFQKLLINK
jgi:diamine N-acetyltransferase